MTNLSGSVFTGEGSEEVSSSRLKTHSLKITSKPQLSLVVYVFVEVRLTVGKDRVP